EAPEADVERVGEREEENRDGQQQRRRDEVVVIPMTAAAAARARRRRREDRPSQSWALTPCAGQRSATGPLRARSRSPTRRGSLLEVAAPLHDVAELGACFLDRILRARLAGHDFRAEDVERVE